MPKYLLNSIREYHKANIHLQNMTLTANHFLVQLFKRDANATRQSTKNEV